MTQHPSTWIEAIDEILIDFSEGVYSHAPDYYPSNTLPMTKDEAVAAINEAVKTYIEEQIRQKAYHRGYEQGRFDQAIESEHPQPDGATPTIRRKRSVVRKDGYNNSM